MHIYIHIYILLDRLIPYCLAHVGSSLPSKFRFKRVCKKPRIDIECWNPHIKVSFLRVPRHVPHIGRTKLRLFWREVKTTSTQVNIPSSYVDLRIGWRAPFLHIHSNGVGLFNLLPRTEWNVIRLPSPGIMHSSAMSTVQMPGSLEVTGLGGRTVPNGSVWEGKLGYVQRLFLQQHTYII